MTTANRAGLTGRPNIAGLTARATVTAKATSRAGLTGKKPAPVPDPLKDVQYTDNLAADAAAELTALESAYRDRAKAEAARFKAATDSEFWFAVCFTSREEKEAFLRKHGLEQIGDKYLDGSAVDRAIS